MELSGSIDDASATKEEVSEPNLGTIPFMVSDIGTANGKPDNQHPLEHQHQPAQFWYRQVMQYSSSSSSSMAPDLMGKDGGGYDLAEFDTSLFHYLDDHDSSCSHDEKHDGGTMRRPTLNIFPSQPMHVDPTFASLREVSASPVRDTCGSKRAPTEPVPTESPNLQFNTGAASSHGADHTSKSCKLIYARQIECTNSKKSPILGQEHEQPKTPDTKTLRRLAQNREAARKSRLRKKAYVQQLESSRIRLAQLEQELQRARAQGIFYGGVLGDQSLPLGVSNLSSDAAAFDMEYTRWVEDHHRLMCELRAAVQENLPEAELRIYVNNCLAHFEVMMNLKSMVTKSDVFHLVSGIWKTPAERCFLWIGGFRPSELFKITLSQIEPLTEQQLVGVCRLQHSTMETEEALSRGLEALYQTLSDIIASDSLSSPPNMSSYMSQMAVAVNKLSTLEGFVRQADNLRRQTVHGLHQLLTTRQAARCFLAMAAYFHRLRALSSIWFSRPRQE